MMTITPTAAHHNAHHPLSTSPRLAFPPLVLAQMGPGAGPMYGQQMNQGYGMQPAMGGYGPMAMQPRPMNGRQVRKGESLPALLRANRIP
jgi:hypothetical protein